MKDNLHNELKKEFQLERMILFSDAVFAIAITLLVIEIKVPELEHGHVSEQSLVQALAHMIPRFIGFFVSFFLIGLYWTVHHRMFGYVVNYNQRLLWLNLIFLLSVVLMPFSTAFYSEYILSMLKTPVVVYLFNICFLGVMNYALWQYVGNPKHNISEGLSGPVTGYFAMRALAVPIVFIVMFIVYLFEPFLAFWIPMLIPFLMIIFRKQYEKKLAKGVVLKPQPEKVSG